MINWSQFYYVKKISKNDNSTIKILMNKSVYLSKNKDEGINQLKYSWIIRSLMYVMSYTRLNIAYSVNILCKFINNSSIYHWNVINKVLKYLRYILYYDLYYIGYLVVLKFIVILIEYLILKIQNPLVNISSHWVEQLCYENYLRKRVSQEPRWN